MSKGQQKQQTQSDYKISAIGITEHEIKICQIYLKK